MIVYSILGVNDMTRSIAFYAAYFRDPDGAKLCAFVRK
jgi:hypothetical protein